MIILTNTTDILQVVLGSAVITTQLKSFVSYRDTTSTTITPQRTALLTNGVTAVNIIPSPAVNTQSICDYISIFNTDTVNSNVTINFNANGSLFELFKVTLASGEKLEYTDAQGWRVFSTAGSIKTSQNQGSNTIGSSLTAVVLGSDVINSANPANTMRDVTGLSFNMLAGRTYYFRFTIPYTSAATATGSRWSVNASAGTAATLSFTSEYSLTTTTTTRNSLIQQFDSPAASNASSASLLNNMCMIEGYIKATVDATLIARFASEVNNSAITAKAGAVLYYQELL